MTKKNIAIVGATGFTGSELVRILHAHPQVKLSLLSSESHKGEAFSEVYPQFSGIVDQTLVSAEEIANSPPDLIFLALPHGISMEYVKQLSGRGIPIVDLSGDFRLSSPSVFEEWYGKTHSFPEGFEEAVYGLPELYADQIAKSKLIANPGCYPSSVILPLAPLVKAGLIDNRSIIADCKSGVTGAGAKSKAVNLFSNVNDNFKAYGLKRHRHSIEIQEKLEEHASESCLLQFTPHLLPVDRGILSTIYAKPLEESFDAKRLREVFHDFYGDAPFVRLLSQPPSIKQVRGTNYCDIYFTYDERTHNIILISCIDNLVKGAAGQAVQNMNILFNWDQQQGLTQIPLYP